MRYLEMILVSPKAERTFVVYEESSDDPEEYVVLDLLLVTAIDFVPADRDRAGNGRSDGV